MLGFLVIVVVGLLVVNYFKNLDSGDTTPSGTQTEEKNSLPKTYKVAAGDSLWSISEKLYGTGYNWVDIRDANKISDPNDITEGQELIIPDVEAKTSDSQIAEATATPATIATPKATSTVKASATPTITIKPTVTASATPKAAIANNDNKDGNQGEVVSGSKEVKAGGNYTVVHGDNLWDIAVAAYGDGFRWTDIAKANQLVNPRVIHSGNVLVIPA